MGKEKSKESKTIVKKLRNKYRLVILNDDTFEEKLSLKLSRLNVFLLTGFGVVFLIAITTVLIAFTPLREYIPGYASTKLRRQALELALSADSIERQLQYHQRYLVNIRNIVEGKPLIDFSDTAVADSILKTELSTSVSKEDSNLRKFVEEEEKFNLSPAGNFRAESMLTFFAPVKGLVTNSFNLDENHLGIDVVAKRNEVVKATQSGVVLFSGWTTETGHVIMIQHQENFVSVYKHNSSLLKAEGELVRTGEPVAIIGNSGELSSGPHLHFELWFNGNPVDPENYISF